MSIKDIHILIVENDAIIALDLKNICEKNGFNYTHITYSNGLKKVFEARPDLILMDIETKEDENIVDKAELICNEYKIPIVFFTRAPSHSYENNKLKNRCSFLPIPFNEEAITLAINTLLNNYRYP